MFHLQCAWEKVSSVSWGLKKQNEHGAISAWRWDIPPGMLRDAHFPAFDPEFSGHVSTFPSHKICSCHIKGRTIEASDYEL